MEKQTARPRQDVLEAIGELLSYTVDAADDDEKIHEQVDIVGRWLNSFYA